MRTVLHKRELSSEWLDWVVVHRLLADCGQTDLVSLLGRNSTLAERRAAAWIMRCQGSSATEITKSLHTNGGTVWRLLAETDKVDRSAIACLLVAYQIVDA